ncbi:MAG: hypothetical protein L0I76_28895 [Pseudonocardia sp.]|nr:hypothetical protein [Pseudonocardia sp.]
MPFVDLIEQAILDHFLTDPAWTPETTLYIGLSSTTPTDAGGNITEPSTGSYARVATTAADWAAASGTAPASKVTNVAKAFATATGDWVAGANLTHFVLMSASTAGTCRAWGLLTTAKPVLNGDTPSFPAGSLVLRQGKSGDAGL